MTAAPAPPPATAQPGEVYWVDIPKAQTVGHEQAERRPYVIVSAPEVNARGTVVGVPLTTVKNPSKVSFLPPYWILIPQKELTVDWGATLGVAQASMAKSEQLRVLDAKRLGTKIGSITITALAAIRLGVASVLSLDP